ncbi:MAG: hypothetical protein COA78_37330 [Blastopirellula sp.]|nr:MAG: hypothetical protein COA78_37330 [Blastopirellula sp.]
MCENSNKDTIELEEVYDRLGLKEVYNSFPVDSLSALKRMQSLKHTLYECLLISDLHHTSSGGEQ